MTNSTQKKPTLLLFGIPLTLVGILGSAYTLFHHIQFKAGLSTDFACNINDFFSCDKIAASPYSEIFTIPLGVWGLGFFISLLAFLVLSQKQDENSTASAHGFFISANVGAVVAIVLMYFSYAVLGAVCLACSSANAAALGLAILAWWRRSDLEFPIKWKDASNGIWVVAFIIAINIIGYQFFAPGPQPIGDDEIKNIVKSNGDYTDKVQKNIPIDRTQYSGYGKDFTKGASNPKVTIVEFADFQCPACAKAAEVISQIVYTFPDQVEAVFKNFPLDPSCNNQVRNSIHPHACTAAAISRCAESDSFFWKFHDKVFQNQKLLSKPQMLKWAEELGLSKSRSEACLSAKYIKDKIADDVRLATELDVQATPTLYLNGKKYTGPLNAALLTAEIKRLLE